MYNILISNSNIPTGQKKWNNTLPQPITNEQWQAIYKLPFKTLTDPNLKWIQYRINHHVLVTNKFLHKIGLIDSNTCTFCKSEPETITHLMWDCISTQSLIIQFTQHCERNNKTITVDKLTFLFGLFSSESVAENNILTVLKQYLYRMRCLKNMPSLNALLFDLSRLLLATDLIYRKNNKYNSFLHLWGEWLFLK